MATKRREATAPAQFMQSGRLKGRVTAAMSFVFGARDDRGLAAAVDIVATILDDEAVRERGPRIGRRTIAIRRNFDEHRPIPRNGFAYRLPAARDFEAVTDRQAEFWLTDECGDWQGSAGYLRIFLPTEVLANAPDRFAEWFQTLAVTLRVRSAIGGYALRVDDVNLADDTEHAMLALLEACPRLDLNFEHELVLCAGATRAKGVGWLTVLDDALWADAGSPVDLDVENSASLHILRASPRAAPWHSEAAAEDTRYRAIGARIANVLVRAGRLDLCPLFRKDRSRLDRWLSRWS